VVGLEGRGACIGGRGGYVGGLGGVGGGGILGGGEGGEGLGGRVNIAAGGTSACSQQQTTHVNTE
jgi:hypothetical protein